MRVTCICGATNRIPSRPTARVRCGKCKREFKPAELARATNEAPADFQLDIEDDRPFQPSGKCAFLPDPTDRNFCLDCGLHKEDH